MDAHVPSATAQSIRTSGPLGSALSTSPTGTIRRLNVQAVSNSITPSSQLSSHPPLVSRLAATHEVVLSRRSDRCPRHCLRRRTWIVTTSASAVNTYHCVHGSPTGMLGTNLARCDGAIFYGS